MWFAAYIVSKNVSLHVSNGLGQRSDFCFGAAAAEPQPAERRKDETAAELRREEYIR